MRKDVVRASSTARMVDWRGPVPAEHIVLAAQVGITVPDESKMVQPERLKRERYVSFSSSLIDLFIDCRLMLTYQLQVEYSRPVLPDIRPYVEKSMVGLVSVDFQIRPHPIYSMTTTK